MVELLLNDISSLRGSPVFFVADMNIDLPKQNDLSSNFSNLLQYNGMTQLLTTATRITINSATLIDNVFHNAYIDNPDCGELDAGLNDHCATFVKKPVSCKKKDGTGITYKTFPFNYNENATQK